MSERTAASYLLANRTIIDNWVDGRRGRILSCDPDAGTVTVLWRRGAYNTLRMEPGRFSVVEEPVMAHICTTTPCGTCEGEK